MDYAEFCERVEAEIVKLSSLVTGVDLATPVPSCPGWDLARLVRHAGTVHRWAAAHVATRSRERIDSSELDVALPDDPAGYPQWLAAGAGPLVMVLRDAGPDTPVWTWGDDHRSGWWARRMLHETTVHRVDAQQALGVRPEIDPVVAADGVDEFLSIVPYGSRSGQRLAELPSGQAIHLHATDDVLATSAAANAGEWLVILNGGGFTWTHGHAKGTVAVRGPAEALLLLVYGRVRPDDSRLTVFGDAGLLASWQEITAL